MIKNSKKIVETHNYASTRIKNLIIFPTMQLNNIFLL